LREIGLTPKFVARIQESGLGLTAGRQYTLWLAEWRRERFPAAFALRMLMLGDPVAEADASIAFGKALLSHLRSAGVIVAKEDGWASPFTLSFLDDLFLFSDRATQHPDGVLAVSATTQLLARASCHQAGTDTFHQALDLGCGCGVLAIRLAQCARRVVAVDVNARALAFSRFNASLNGVSNISFRHGDLYAPVDGERFDVIVCQPPFVANCSDSDAVTSFHAGPDGDEIALRVLRGVSDHLAPDGQLILLNDWPMLRASEASIVERVRGALGGLNGHLVVLLSDAIDISTHCASYASAQPPGAEETVAREIGQALAHFAGRGIVSVRQGLCVLQATPAGSSGGYQLLVPGVRWTNCSRADIHRILAALQFQADGIASHLPSSVRVAPGTTFVCRWKDAPENGSLFAEPPPDVLFPTLPLNHGALELIQTLDSSLSIEEGISRLAAAASVPPEALHVHVESALLTGMMRGILTLHPATGAPGDRA